MLVAERDRRVIGWAGLTPYDAVHAYYATVAEATLYVERGSPQSGCRACPCSPSSPNEAERRGLHKLVGKLFTSNRAEHRPGASLRLAPGGRPSTPWAAGRRVA